ncbi:hypothetical protein HHI36_000559 [Cryptolaemus montrouzieri]|uniref:Uncharacterized protein n=1 Tax=Cryptolaemus montrouzieri TaxID=559131 RepID=A0ABD2P5N8_9CUCU
MRKDKEETLPDSTMADAELSKTQDKITSQENDGSILDGTTSESVEGNRTNLINQTTDPRNSPFVRRSSRSRRTLILKIMNTISLRVGVNVVN